MARGSSPHTRGALLTAVDVDGGGRIIPAYAGSTPSASPKPASHRDHPRIRGEHFSLFLSGVVAGGSSPHTRGARRRRRGRLGRPWIIPAYAGSTLPRHRRQRTVRGSSPHTRGAPQKVRADIPQRRIIPAYAGSTTTPFLESFQSTDHPRIRGEHGGPERDAPGAEGSSPHTRGAPSATHISSQSWRIIPADAGSTLPGMPATQDTTDHPRIRGEHLGGGAVMRIEGGSSPHTRGAPSTNPTGSAPSRDHPRIRGEHRSCVSALRGQWGSSPHTRGALCVPRTRLRWSGIIPAYAGSTVDWTTVTSRVADHPRIRGEHGVRSNERVVYGGSSPHTRGAHVAAHRHQGDRGIIPAYAGSTWRRTGTPPRLRDHPRIRGEHQPADRRRR